MSDEEKETNDTGKKEEIQSFMDRLSKDLDKKIKTRRDNQLKLSPPLLILTKEEHNELMAAIHERNSFEDDILLALTKLNEQYLETKKKLRKSWQGIEMKYGLFGKKLQLEQATGEIKEILE